MTETSNTCTKIDEEIKSYSNKFYIIEEICIFYHTDKVVIK